MSPLESMCVRGGGVVRFRRLLSIGLTMPVSIASALLLGMTVPRAAVGLNPVTIDCGDADRISASVDLATLTKLESVMQEMLLNPTGETCTLTQQQDPGDSESRPFVVGAGSYHFDICHINFVVRAFRNANGLHGVQRIAFPPDTPASCGGPGTLKTNITCLDVAGNVAQVKGVVQESTGQFANPDPNNPNYAPPGSVVSTDAQDNETGLPDMVEQSPPPFADPADKCTAAISAFAFPLDRGHIEVEG
jgi:hypothetical protein